MSHEPNHESDPHSLPSIRIGDVERQQVTDLLSKAMADGYLTTAEFDERCAATWKANTRADLAKLTSDLPTALATSPAAKNLSSQRRESEFALGILGDTTRKGSHEVARHVRLIGFLGDVDADFRHSDFPPGETIIDAYGVLGGVDILLPAHVRVIDDGIGFLGDYEVTLNSTELPQDAPVVRVRGIGLLGEVKIKVSEK